MSRRKSDAASLTRAGRLGFKFSQVTPLQELEELMQDWAELLKGIADLIRSFMWPLTVSALVFLFRKEIREILVEIPTLIRRARNVKGFSVEASFSQLEHDLKDSPKIAAETRLQLPEAPLQKDDDAGN